MNTMRSATSRAKPISWVTTLENVRSDLVWLKLRLLNPQNTEEINRAKRELDMRSKRGLAAAERAWALNKEGGPAARVRVDSWRLARWAM